MIFNPIVIGGNKKIVFFPNNITFYHTDRDYAYECDLTIYDLTKDNIKDTVYVILQEAATNRSTDEMAGYLIFSCDKNQNTELTYVGDYIESRITVKTPFNAEYGTITFHLPAGYTIFITTTE